MGTLTILARRPDSRQEWDDLSEPDDDDPTQEMLTKLRGRRDASGHIVGRASSIQDIAKILSKSTSRHDLIQIIGHGAPGGISLGDLWIHRHQLPRRRNRTYSLNGNPNTYGILINKIAAPTRVLLLGCRAGAALPEENIGSQVEDGPTFIFNFARLWRVEVSAPWDYFTSNDFDENGIFANPSKLVIASGLTVVMPPGPAPIHHPTVEPPPFDQRLEFKKFALAPMFYQSNFQLQLARELFVPLTGTYFAQIGAQDFMAAAELIFEVTWRSSEWTCETINYGELLRLRNGTETHLMIPDEGARQKIRDIIGHLSKTAYTP